MSTIKKQDSVWKDKEAGEEAQHACQKEQEQLASLRAHGSDAASHEAQPPSGIPREDRDYEAGFGGQEDLEDRYATTSGEN
ncbi:hypothetical protein EDB84DRAFT_13802 [Lactarius hengduanensis]|nr:hypothetical protein EDB84DRAFT_13802 [Lactarius hengduanensis]